MFSQFEKTDLSIPISWVIEEDAYITITDFGNEHEETYDTISHIIQLIGNYQKTVQPQKSNDDDTINQLKISEIRHSNRLKRTQMTKGIERTIPLYPFSEEAMIINDNNLTELLVSPKEEHNEIQKSKSQQDSEYDTDDYDEKAHEAELNDINEYFTNFKNGLTKSFQELYSPIFHNSNNESENDQSSDE